MTLAILQGFVPNQGDAWGYSLDQLGRYFDTLLARPGAPQGVDLPAASPVALLDTVLPPEAATLIGPYIESARLLGRRTAELHLALASESDLPEFTPEPFTRLYQRALYQSMRTLSGKVLPLLRLQINRLPAELRPQAARVLDRQAEIGARFKRLLGSKISALRIRCHGDYHLGQVLYTGKDFVIIDFEGEPARPITERRIKRSPLRDVAGMLRSFHYAAYAALNPPQGKEAAAADPSLLEPWAEYWQRWVGAEFLKSYLEHSAGGRFTPDSRGEIRVLLDALLMEKVVYELGYELNNRPDWVKIPLRGIEQLLDAEAG